MKPAYTALLGLGIAVALAAAAADSLSVDGTDPSAATKASITAPDDTEGSQQQRRLQMSDPAACVGVCSTLLKMRSAFGDQAVEECQATVGQQAAALGVRDETIAALGENAEAAADAAAAAAAAAAADAAAAAEALAAANAEASDCEQTLSGTIDASSAASEACAATVAAGAAELQDCTTQNVDQAAAYEATLTESATTAEGCELQRNSDAATFASTLATSAAESDSLAADLVALTESSVASLAAANDNTAVCVASLGTMTTSRDTCTADLATMTASEGTCTADLALMTTSLVTAQATIAEMEATIAELNAGLNDCATWILGALGQHCNTVCTAAGHACTSGDWGVGDQASLEAALEAAGQSSGDRAALCSGNYVGSSSDGNPRVYPPTSQCYWQTGATTSCSASQGNVRRLCRCG